MFQPTFASGEGKPIFIPYSRSLGDEYMCRSAADRSVVSRNHEARFKGQVEVNRAFLREQIFDDCRSWNITTFLEGSLC